MGVNLNVPPLFSSWATVLDKSVPLLLTLAVNKNNIFILFLYTIFSIHPISFIACLWIFSILKRKHLL